jgi:hypothetical protein
VLIHLNIIKLPQLAICLIAKPLQRFSVSRRGRWIAGTCFAKGRRASRWAAKSVIVALLSKDGF